MFISLNRYQNPEEMILCHIKLHRVQKDHHHNILHFTHSLVRESISGTPECNQSVVCKTKENNQHGFVKCSHYLTILHRIVYFRFSVNYETIARHWTLVFYAQSIVHIMHSVEHLLT